MNILRNSSGQWGLVLVGLVYSLPAFSANPVIRFGQVILMLFALVATCGFVGVTTRRVWEPLLRKVGFWTSSAVLGLMLGGAMVLFIALGLKLGAFGFSTRLGLAAATTGLLVGWSHAALRGASVRKKA